MKNKIKNRIADVTFIWQFALDDFKTKYAGSALGILWAFLQPILTMTLYWFVFELGFKSQPVDDFPFVLWLMAGLVPWFFVSEAIVNATTCLTDYSYLVKKVLFNINILPLAKIISVFLVQIVLILFVIICYMIGGYYPDIYYIQLIIYILYMIILTAGVAYITATLYVFFKDTIQVISILMQVLFWLTPIVWSYEVMPDIVQRIFVFNPVYYIVSGFRDVFIYNQWFSQGILLNVYYWIMAFLLLVIGIKLFNKTKAHFADVL